MITDPQEDYARGEIPFLGVTVRLDSKPLIPRTETEYWTEQAITDMSGVGHRTCQVLDLFSGSGCIGLAVLAHIPGAHVTFADKEARHFPTIQKSITLNGIDSARVTFIESDVWSSISGAFDVVLANPPYISRERATASEDVIGYEPHEALFADDDGFALIEQFLHDLPSHIHKGGTAWIEHEPFQATRITQVAATHGFSATTHTDQYNIKRYTILRHMA
ncbi:MAG: N5-glutamine methyltransferase family protein [Patescibacteria group bacterium UBA2163]